MISQGLHCHTNKLICLEVLTVSTLFMSQSILLPIKSYNNTELGRNFLVFSIFLFETDSNRALPWQLAGKQGQEGPFHILYI